MSSVGLLFADMIGWPGGESLPNTPCLSLRDLLSSYGPSIWLLLVGHSFCSTNIGYVEICDTYQDLGVSHQCQGHGGGTEVKTLVKNFSFLFGQDLV